MSRPLLALCVLCCCTFLVGLGRQAVTDADEAYYAEASREMVESGDWLTPHFNYTDRWEKPVLYYWLTAATYTVTGPTEWAARLWSALSGFGLVLVVWAMARPGPGTASTAWLAGAMTATAFGYVSMARQALPDLPLAFCITLGIWAALDAGDRERGGRPARARWALAGLAAGLGFLLKGPVALVVPGVVLLPLWWRERRSGWPGAGGLLVAAGVAAAIGLPWYLAMYAVHGTAYIDSFFVGDNLERFATSRFNDARSVLFYVPILLGGLVPWSAYLLTLFAPTSRTTEAGDARQRAESWRLVLWAAMPLLFFTLSVGKQPRYILPVLPPLAVLVAQHLSHRITVAGARPDPLLRWATGITAVLLALVGVALLRAQPLFVSASSTWTVLGAFLLGVCATALTAIALLGRWRLLYTALPAAGAVLTLAIQFGAMAGVRPEPVEEIAGLIRTHRTAGEAVGQYGVFTRNLVFYMGFAQTPIFDHTQALTFLRTPARVLLVTDAGRLADLRRDSGLALRVLGEQRYLNAGNVRLRTMLDPSPAANLQTAVLVANR